MELRAPLNLLDVLLHATCAFFRLHGFSGSLHIVPHTPPLQTRTIPAFIAFLTPISDTVPSCWKVQFSPTKDEVVITALYYVFICMYIYIYIYIIYLCTVCIIRDGPCGQCGINYFTPSACTSYLAVIFEHRLN